MTSTEVSLIKKNKRRKRQETRHNAIERYVNLYGVSKDTFSTETSTAISAMPPQHPAQYSVDLVMRQSQAENEGKAKIVLENAADGSPVITSAEVNLRKKNKRRKRQKTRHNAIESTFNLSGVPKDTFSTETFSHALDIPSQHSAQYSMDLAMRRCQEENEGTEQKMIEKAADGCPAMTSAEVDSRKKNKKRKRQKTRLNVTESKLNNINLSCVPKDTFSTETSTPTLDMPPQHPVQYSMDPIMRQCQEENEGKEKNMLEKATDGSPAMTSAEVNSRKKNKKRKRRKTRLNDIENNINLSGVPKDSFSPETSAPTLDMPPQHPAQYSVDPVMIKCQEENEGIEQNMLEKATDGSPAMTSAEINSRKKNKKRKRLKTRPHDIESIVNLSGVPKGDIADLSLVCKQDDCSRISHFPLGRRLRTITSHSKKKLLVLDVNGLLADIVPSVPKGYEAGIKIYGKSVFKRPFCDDFLGFCFDRFHVGIWSSRIRKNLAPAIKFLLRESASKLLFCWDRSHCTKTKFCTVEDKRKLLVLKELRKLWEKVEHRLPWEKGDFNESNTLLLDDSPYKALRNPMNTAIFPYSYQYNDNNDTSLGPGGDLRVYLEGLAMAENVQEYVASNPYGQPAITESNPHWDFYREFIEPGKCDALSKKKKKKKKKKR